MNKVIDYIFGSVEVKVKGTFAELPIDFQNDVIQISDLSICDEEISFAVPLFKLKKLKHLLSGKEFSIVRIKGLPEFLIRYKKRYGMFIGIIICILLLFISSGVIWTFNISGNSKVSDEEILNTLSKLGCSYGTNIDKIDFDMLCNDFLIEYPDISWISVNMDGTHANVEVRETLRGEKISQDCNNIVASRDAQIVQITAYSGKKQVAIGDVVKKGELLISAIGSFGEGRNKIEGADGLVLAETTIEFVIEVPYETVRKIDLDNEISVNRVKIFDFWINLFVNSGIPGEKYDKIISNNQVDLFGEVYLPVWVETQTFKEYYTETVFISPEEAKLVAVSDYRARLRELALSCEILKITARHESADDAYKIYCSVFCICDIAEPSPIIVK